MSPFDAGGAALPISIGRDGRFAISSAMTAARDLADQRARQRLAEGDQRGISKERACRAGTPSIAQRDLLLCPRDDEGFYGLPHSHRVCRNGDILHRRVPADRLLYHPQLDVLAADQDQILGAVSDENIPLLVHMPDVASV